jgi:NTE family protein
MNKLGYSSKLNAEWAFLSLLKEEGRKAADDFLVRHGDNLGKKSTVDIDQLLAEL